LIAQGRLPEGGLEELQKAVLRELERLEALPDSELRTAAGYYRVAGLLAVAMYVYCPQGRYSGIESLLLEQVVDIFDQGFAVTDELVAFPSKSYYFFRL